jgi:hypothetical protein
MIAAVHRYVNERVFSDLKLFRGHAGRHFFRLIAVKITVQMGFPFFSDADIQAVIKKWRPA